MSPSLASRNEPPNPDRLALQDEAGSFDHSAVFDAGDSGSPTAESELDAVEHYPSSQRPDDTFFTMRRLPLAPQPDLLFIEAQARQGRSAPGETAVRNHHDQIFLAARGAELRQRQQEVQVRSKELRARERESRDLTRQLSQTPRFKEVPAPEGNTPWTLTERFEVAAYYLAALTALFVGVANGASILRATGEAQFQNWLTPLTMTFGVVLMAFWVKAMGRHMPEGRVRWWYTTTSLFAGGVFFAHWLWEYAFLFGKALMPIEDQLAGLSLGLSGNGSGAGGAEAREGFRMILSGMAADALVCGGIWLLIGKLSEGHVLNRSIENPQWTPIRRSLDRVVELKQEEEKLLGVAHGRLTALAAEREDLIDQALGLYRSALQHHSR